MSWWEHNGLIDVRSVRAQLEDFLTSPERLFDPAEQPRIQKLQWHIRNVNTIWEWGKDNIAGSLSTAANLFDYLSSQCDLVQKECLIQHEARSPIILPTEATLSELICRLGPDPRAWHALGPRKFEELLAEIWAGLGWETILTPPSGDGGFDIRAVRNTDGISACYLIEAKAYDPSRPVGIEVVRHLYGVVERERATHGILATTSRFTKGAVEESRALRYRISLADFQQVLKWSKMYLRKTGR
jgi:HJR/Mrr/RecB family endonuclease